MILIDGVEYELWTPPNEDDFERVVKEHAQDIFGEQSVYLDLKQKLKSRSGIGSIPDGYVIMLGDSPHWHIVEVELSSHPLHEHIVSQVSKFIIGIKNPRASAEILATIYAEINGDDFLQLKVKKATEPTEIYKFLSDLISKPPILTIIIEKDTEGLREAISTLAHTEIKVVEFKTFTREGVGLAVHAHLFEPLYRKEKEREGVPIEKPLPIEIPVKPSYIKDEYLYIPQEYRSLFPGFKIPFRLETDTGVIETHVYALYPAKWREGDMNSGAWFSKGLRTWFKAHPELKPGDKVRITAIEPMKEYLLEIVK